jgi:hypothetical protein
MLIWTYLKKLVLAKGNLFSGLLKTIKPPGRRQVSVPDWRQSIPLGIPMEIGQVVSNGRTQEQ